MFKFIRETTQFLGGLAKDPRIPARDKALLAGLCAYLATPFDLIPDFIPLLGSLDDLIVAVVVMDFVFNTIPEEIVLTHFKWAPERYYKIRRWVRRVSWMIPNFIRRRIWKSARAEQRAPEA